MIINKRTVFRLPLFIGIFAWALAMLVACSEDEKITTKDKIPSVEPIVAAMKTMVPLAYAASVAMPVVHGSAPLNVSVDNITNLCTSHPCVSALTLSIDENTLPVTLDSYGKLYVAGYWFSDTEAVISLVFVDMEGGTSGFPVFDISTVPVRSDGTNVTIAYTSGDMNYGTDAGEAVDISEEEFNIEIARLDVVAGILLDNAEFNMTQDYWLVNVDLEGTPENTMDDTYELSGGALYLDATASSGSAYTLGIARAAMSHDCSLNPTSGDALINEVEVSSEDSTSWVQLAWAAIDFQPLCNGRADVRYGISDDGIVKDGSVDLGFSN